MQYVWPPLRQRPWQWRLSRPQGSLMCHASYPVEVRHRRTQGTTAQPGLRLAFQSGKAVVRPRVQEHSAPETGPSLYHRMQGCSVQMLEQVVPLAMRALLLMRQAPMQ